MHSYALLFHSLVGILFLLFTVQPSQIQAQGRWELGAASGVSILFGDLGGGKKDGRTGPRDYDFLSQRYAFYVESNYSILPDKLKIGINLGHALLSGNDKYSANPLRRMRNQHVFTPIYFSELKLSYKPLEQYPVWFHVGFGYTRFQPKAKLNGKTYNLQPLGTEGQLIGPYKNLYNRNTFTIPFGIEAKVKEWPNYSSLWIEGCFRKTFTDWIDDTHNRYADKTQIEAISGPAAAQLADRSQSDIVGYSYTGSIRGNPEDNDNYMFIAVKFRVPVKEVKNLFLKFSKDRDHDGVKDKLDKCLWTPKGVPVDENGCPLDDDGDGVPNYRDKCPDEAGVKSLKGCPDDDNDGVANHKDSCPDVKGLTFLSGCPDADGDGVPDHRDKCPDEKGLPQFGGCKEGPKPPVVEKDTNIFYDYTSENRQSVENIAFLFSKDLNSIINANRLTSNWIDSGQVIRIPVTEQELNIYNVDWKRKLKFAARRISFEYDRASLTQQALSDLYTIATILNEHREIKVKLHGHTDADGAADYNQALSEKRANSVMYYLISKGVNAGRIKAFGYGENKPLLPNTTPFNKKVNRRVEIEIIEN